MEKHIRKKLRQHTTPLDTDSLWESIAADLPTKEGKRRRPLLFYWWLGWMALGGGGLMLSLVHHAQKYTNGHHTETVPAYDPAEGLPPPRIANEVHFTIPSSSPVIDASHTPPQKKTYNGTYTLAGPTPLQRKEEGGMATVVLPSEKTASPPAYRQDAQVGSWEQPLELALLDHDTPLVEWRHDINPRQAEAVKDFENAPEEEEEDEKRPEALPRKTRIFFGIRSAAGFSKNRVEARQEQMDYYAKRHENDYGTRRNIEMNIEAILLLKNNMRIRTGFSYRSVSSEFTKVDRRTVPMPSSSSPYAGEYPSRNTNVQDLALPESPLASRLQVSSSASIAHTSTHTNRHTMLDVPLVLGYQKEFDKVSLVMEAGAYFNLLTYSNAYVNDETGTTGYHHVSEGKYAFYSQSHILSTYAGVSIQYKLKGNMYMNIGGHLRHMPFSMTTSEAPIEERLHSVGIHTGLFMRF